jgi:biotin carboxyl carrier protein
VKLLDLNTLVKWLNDADIHTFELEERGLSLRIAMQQLQPEGHRIIAPSLQTNFPKRRLHLVVADANGIFLTAHPLRAVPLVASGDAVVVGDVLGLLKIGDVIYKAVRANRQGRVIRTLAGNGQLIETGTPLFELDIRKPRDLTPLRHRT